MSKLTFSSGLTIYKKIDPSVFLKDEAKQDTLCIGKIVLAMNANVQLILLSSCY